MADPDKPSEFSPEELDRLEDALERWTSATDDPSPVPEDSLLAPHLRARLEDYRALLAMTRDELPMEDVPDTLLAGVLAEAHDSARPRTRPVTRRELVPAGPGLWERLRRSMLLPGFALAGSAALLLWVVQPSGDTTLGDDVLLPGFALAGSAALLLWVVQPAGDTTLGDDEVLLERGEGLTAQAPARLSRLSGDAASPAPAAAEAPRLEEGSPAEAFADSVPNDRDAEKAADAPNDAPSAGSAPTPAAAAIAEADLKDIPKADRPGAKKKSKALEPAEVYPGLGDGPLTEGVDKEALRDTLDKADAARRKGGCPEAMNLYLEAMNMSGAASERARARAGFGLCLSSQGDDDRADKYFDAARLLSPAIDGWIKRERGDGAARKAPAKPSARAKAEAPLDL